MKKILASMVLTTVFLLTFSGCDLFHEHEFGEWKTVKAATCTEDGTEEHVCECGEKETQVIPATGHDWKDATCKAPKTCTVCGATEGGLGNHDWEAATCTKPKTCKLCKKTEGKAAGHSWQAATCTSPKKCSKCGKTEGKALGHKYSGLTCTRCGEEREITRGVVPSIIDITYLNINVNYVGGLDVYIECTNKDPSKTIKYIYYNLSFFNAVGDKLSDEISGDTYASLRYTGPIAPGGSSDSNQYWRACFYNATYGDTLTFNSITIEYTDGTKVYLDEDVANEAVVRWR